MARPLRGGRIPGYFLPLVLIAVLLSACTGGGLLAPGADYNAARSPKYYIVFHGDTLYSIAWAVSVDYHLLAKWNHIRPPYLIKPGQRLRITPDTATARPVTRRPAPRGAQTWVYYRVRKGDTLYSIARQAGYPVKQVARWNRIKRPYRIYPGQRLRVRPQKAQTVVAQRPASTRRTPRATRRPAGGRRATRPQRPIVKVGRWQWPARGKIVKNYDPRRSSKGVDIAGPAGTAIYAAASGKVVYQGSGLRGYGQLIIIKHNSDYLSAYAHCSRILVKEGQQVRRGQKIAIIGSTGTNSVRLHFEIRRRGTPVNPLLFLPKRP